MRRMILTSKKDFENIYEFVGSIDTYALASYRKSLTNVSMIKGGEGFEFKRINTINCKYC